VYAATAAVHSSRRGAGATPADGATVQCVSTRRGVVGRLVPVVLLCWLALPVSAAAAETGPWVWPLSGPRQTSRAFTLPTTTYGTGHRGADLPSTGGAAVRAAGAGRVSYAGLLAGRGVVVVTHGALRTTYEPVAAAVEIGDVVPLGGLLGTLETGHDGCPRAACLHWGLRRGELYLDPVRLVVAGPVRLLPPGPGGDAPIPPGATATGVTPTGATATGVTPPGATATGVTPPGVTATAWSGARRPPPPAAPGATGPGALRSVSEVRDRDSAAAVAAAALVAGTALLVRPRFLRQGRSDRRTRSRRTRSRRTPSRRTR